MFYFFHFEGCETGLSPLLFRKLSNPDIFSSTGKAKLQRQLSQDDSKLRRGSLASSLSGKYLILFSFNSCGNGASLVAQWLRIPLPMQGTQVWAPVREDPTCCGATKPMHHSYWACALEPANHNYRAHVPQLLKPVCLELVLHNKRSHRSEKPVHCNEE